MENYTAFLRAINVGKHNRVKMIRIKEILLDLGLTDIKTWLQSGNVIFKSDESPDTLRLKIEKAFLSELGFEVPTIIRSVRDLESIINDCPFSIEKIKHIEQTSNITCLYFAMANHDFTDEDRQALESRKSEKENYVVLKNNMYMVFDSGIRNTKLVSKLKTPITVRNYNTLFKVLALAKS